ncbi:MAG: FKBP-type peptidyl-prolyl cis-trans isomerase [Ardenticatenales bacterium]|nr:FKBP-type peptidyl-prolyl cis-trans isomerase [Ardenticatenales bacterium]
MSELPVLGENAVTLDNGLTIEDKVVGQGAEAGEDTRVTVHYTGWLENGTKFDSSLDRNQPFLFEVGEGKVIKGWDEGVKGMRVGGTRLLVLPPSMAYGAHGASDIIPAYAMLIFEVSLLNVEILPARPKPVRVDSYLAKPSGLQYAVLREGSGRAAKQGNTVAVHYTGWLESGVVFDSSFNRGQPIEFALGTGRVIPGWDEGVAGMRVGERRQLRIPYQLAYGEMGRGPIPPRATLIFDVELMNVR